MLTAALPASSRKADTSCRTVAPASERGRPSAVTTAPLRPRPPCGDKGRKFSAVFTLPEARMSEIRPTSLTVESPPRTIAVRLREGKGTGNAGTPGATGMPDAPGLVWLGGFKSDMKGTKAEALDRWAEEKGRACLRFDYSGHGESGGAFEDGTLGRWLAEAVAVYTAFAKGPQVLVGSSMGGWIALLLARALRGRKDAAPIAGIKREIEDKGVWLRPSEYGEEPYPITKGLIEEGRNHLLLGGLIENRCPVHILQGVQDPDVPWRHAVELVSRFSSDDVVLTLIKDGDHRLSRPEDIERLLAAVAEF